MDQEAVLERLYEVVESVIGKAPFDKDVAEELGMSRANYSNIKKKGNLPLEKITDYCGLKKISISWIIHGQSSQMLADSSGEILKIPYLNKVNASAGGGAFNEDENYTHLSLDPAYAKLLGISDKDNIDAITVTGESMEPTLKDGSIILINRNKTDIVNGSIFVINAGGTIYIKRLMMNPNGNIDMLSDNSIIPTQKALREESIVLGKVIGALEKV